MHFLAPTSSLAPVRPSAYLLGVFSSSIAQPQASNTLCPTIPWYTPPWGGDEVGRGIPGQGSAMALEEGAGKSQCEWQVASLSNKWVYLWVMDSKYIWKIVSVWAPRRPHGSPTVTRWILTRCVLLPCYQVHVLFYRGEDVWAASGKPAPHSREEEGSELALGMKREREWVRERLFRAWFLSFIVCPLRFEYAFSQQMREMLQTLTLLAFSLSLLFYLQLNAFQMDQLYREHFW